MLVELSVQNVAIIDQAQLALGPGFTVLTGETGAGKSLFVDALELALGGRADTDLVRSGAVRAVVAATFDLTSRPEVAERAIELGAALEDGLLYIQREVLAEGRSQARIAGRAVPVSTLRELGEMLVDLHGQHDHQSLFRPERHVEFLDAWAGEEARRRLQDVQISLQERNATRAKLAALRGASRDRERRLDLIRFQIDEIGEAKIEAGEYEVVQGALRRLRSLDKIQSLLQSALEDLAERETSAEGAIAQTLRPLEEAARLDTGVQPGLDLIREASVNLSEGVRSLREALGGLESDPEALAAAEERLDLLNKLRRKYGDDETQILAYFDEIVSELALLEQAEEGVEGLTALIEEQESRLLQMAEALTSLRKEKAEEFARLVERELAELGMEKAVFCVRIEAKEIDETGADAVEFDFSSNAGEPPRPLAKIASGGEISRAMLAIKAALAGRAGVPTLIFDEVDTGLGGRAAAMVARKMERLAESYQVLSVSHLPQIAARANRHFRIEKVASESRTRTEISELGPEQRIDEIARMLAGEQISESARANARELLGA